MTTVTAGERKKLVINPSMREIIVPKSERVFGAYNEGGVERKYFLCPRLIGGTVDMTECFVFINYISSSGKHGQILCEDVDIAPDPACVTFSWLLTPNVFDENKDATIYFSVQVKQTVKEDLRPVFSTKIAQGKSYATIDATREIQENYPDVLMQMLERIVRLEGVTKQEALDKAFEEYFDELDGETLAKKIKTNESLKVTAEGALAVNVTDDVSKDNTLPVTSATVYTQIGNINSLLETI